MIYVECKLDKALIQAMGISKEDINHEGGTVKVCNKLKKTSDSKGMVDEDVLRSYSHLWKGLKADNSYLNNKIRVFRDVQKNNYLFVLCPRLEEWVVEAARESHVQMSDYKLPNVGDELHKKANIKLGKFENLIHKLKVKSERVKVLNRLVKG